MAAGTEELEKKLRNLRKKLAQIDKLKEKDQAELDDAAREKVASEPSLRKEADELAKQSQPEAPLRRQQHQQVLQQSQKLPAKPAAASAGAPAKAKIAAVEPSPPSAPPADAEKRIKNIKKKLQQIDKLKQRAAEGEALDPEAQQKVESEAELKREVAALEAGEEYVPAVAPAAPAAPAEDTSAKVEDPHAVERAQALEAAPGDLGLLIDDETEKRFKSLQKKLRDIGKLREKDKLDKLQQGKLTQEPGLIEEIQAIRLKADQLVAERRKQMTRAPPKAETSQSQPKKTTARGFDWQCNECGATGAVADLIGGEGAMACNKCGSTELTHYSPEEDDEADGDEGGQEEQKTSKKSDCKDLKTNRQKKPPPAVKKSLDDTPPSVESAKWPEVKEILQSGDRGVDKSRQKKAIEVSRAKDGAPYDAFDQVLLCVELKLPPGVLASEAFQLYFPGALSDGLLELILKENQLPTVPPGIQQLQRIRSIDLSHNQIESLPDTDTWDSISASLELLDLSFNKLTSIAELAPLKKLSQLKVDANQLTSLDGVSWKELKQLVNLSAVSNQLTDIPEAVGEHAASLEYLELSENKLTTVPPNISELKKLKSLNIAGNPIKDQKIVKAAEKGLKDVKAYLSKIGSKGKK
eukprot:CAMPEP_0115348614 /NCGR_PEP_ID=MMETSP0270-20121206/95495_1 /TAXON_ID=71861 /ORGANISM="Scrippsiella trochoidea, Strain CCMP3099" /LENGTH=637 /DNA_ID=CAMNT_0002770589 /DNA_START=14 /DNA_END=1928 /DNA_ORIENTATION=-